MYKACQLFLYLKLQIKKGNILADHEGISAVFVSHFSNILALAIEAQYPDLSHIILHGYVTEEDANVLTRQVAISEIEEAIKKANPHKA